MGTLWWVTEVARGLSLFGGTCFEVSSAGATTTRRTSLRTSLKTCVRVNQKTVSLAPRRRASSAPHRLTIPLTMLATMLATGQRTPPATDSADATTPLSLFMHTNRAVRPGAKRLGFELRTGWWAETHDVAKLRRTLPKRNFPYHWQVTGSRVRG